MDTIGIPNAPHWLNTSMVIVKEDYVAGDEAWVLHQLIGIDSNNNALVTGKHKDIVFVQRMVQPGSVVSVKRSGDRVKTVHLPEGATELLWNDLEYIVAQIEKLNEPPLTAEEQKSFLPGANGLSLVT